MNKPTLNQKLAKHFGIKSSGKVLDAKAINEDDRTIKAIANTYYFIDSDNDMLIKGCSQKSINDRGPQSNATAKIKHQSDHILNTKNAVGRIKVLDEREIDGKFGLYFESYLPQNTKGNDDLANYKEGIYDNHSIGFRYKIIELAERDGDEQSSKNWAEFYPLAINQDKADMLGYFWVIKEIELFEISVVSFGANELTPYLGSKSKDANDKLKAELFERIDSLNAQLKSNADNKDERKNIDLESLQLKQIITDLKLEQPTKTNTPSKEPNAIVTETGVESKTEINLLSIITKNY